MTVNSTWNRYISFRLFTM